ncbi:glycosyltransferase family 39 protein, partial [Candidatus Woesearchaeota archaeon]|nr:glycosyltransferase family 39 protein [Candidatus Woesearchaeota archaeon]
MTNLIQRISNLEKYSKYALIAIIFYSAIVFTLTAFYHVSGDGCWYLPVGKFIARNFKIPLFEPLGRDEPFWSPPVYHLLVAMVYYFFGKFNSEVANFAVKFVSPIFGVLSLAASFMVIKKLKNTRIAFYSIIFLASVPIFIDYGVLSYVESTLLFFILMSIYFALNERVILSAVFAGLSILVKYNGVFILPVLIFILHSKFNKEANKRDNLANRKIYYRNVLVVVIVPLLIASPWFIRNWALLGNPIWPFLNFLFHGYQLKSYTEINPSILVSPKLFVSTYLGIFGVPDGNYAALSFFKINYLWLLFAGWLAGTLIFMMPLIIGMFNLQKTDNQSNYKKIILVWILSYLILFFLYVINVGPFVSRMLLPAFPAIATIWAGGFEKLLFNKKFGSLLTVLIIAVIVGMLLSEFFKFGLSSRAWGFYDSDFNWVKLNTKNNAIFIANGQCVPYNIERTSLYATNETIKKADWIWVNQKFTLDKKSIFDDQTLKLIESQDYAI